MTFSIFRIIRHDFHSWVPVMVVTSMVAFLVGVCINMRLWAAQVADGELSEPMAAAVTELNIVAVVVYTLVVFLSLISLGVVGSGSVAAASKTFANWRLLGATTHQVLRACLVLIGSLAAIGGVVGAVLSFGFSGSIIEVLGSMASTEEPLPAYRPQVVSVPLTVAATVVTCVVCSVAPAVVASRIPPARVLRAAGYSAQKRFPVTECVASAVLLLAVGLFVAAALTLDAPRTIEFTFNAVMTLVITAVLLASVAAGLIARLVLALLAWACTRCGAVRTGLALQGVVSDLSATRHGLAALSAGVGGSVALLTVVFSIGRTVDAMTGPSSSNTTDALFLASLFAGVLVATGVALFYLAASRVAQDVLPMRAVQLTWPEIVRQYVRRGMSLSVVSLVIAAVPAAVSVPVLYVMLFSITDAARLVVPTLPVVLAVAACAVVPMVPYLLAVLVGRRFSLREAT